MRFWLMPPAEMKLVPAVCLAFALINLQPAGADNDEEETSLVGFEFSVPADWLRVGKGSKFVDGDGIISPEPFDLDGKEMPITVTARRMDRDAELTSKNIEKKLEAFVGESVAKAKKMSAAEDYSGPEITKADLDGCGLQARKAGGRKVYVSTFILPAGEEDTVVMKATTVTYIDGDSLRVLSILGVLQHYREYAEEIRKIAESAKPKGD